ncbi:HAD-IG family 5'-nucleotidase [Pseudobacteriovorax antillogorgiicola]|uniref:HAD superfamily (Subfamily IG) hydrolase, 5'-nucleotidase n=1 Tax=Pseudobacteriovorax antillogorgiicola TaxID=1513793 RepID=A0A1Y6BUF8_9BACT|nr:HAD-IG family 5'-nucleotidase [Pseudobacteriovorax antillogorgiicola]TCS53816.1 HAD superfamily 5'-nucleotidase-like hydrolase [Pseudobacteriovorax antillogorgiicola]SMF21933.1 HAD superfamily (subfamily IG) hydrolase, 5'-nucleotidase [Pseudobacteriovorax antillogorgiicola]
MQKLDKTQKIFVNRSLNMGSVTSIGFDMDHTLARYHRENFENLAFHKTLEKFIEAGYPEELKDLKFNPKFVIRGLLVDRSKGNLLKVDSHKYVKIAYHGHTKLEKSERHQLYNAQGYKADSFLSVDTFFALSEVQLFTEIVDYMRRHPGLIKKSFREVYADLREFIDLSHRDGSIKEEVLQNLDRYIVKDPDLPGTLIKLIEGGKKLFLLTNSDWTYTHAVMSYLLDGASEDYPKWQDYFDYSIVSGGKPNFFTGSNPFFEVVDQNGLLKQHNGPLTRGGLYHGGNAKLFEKLTDQKGDQILYIGDHIYGDIMRSKELFNWRTLLVVEELEEEFHALDQTQNSMDQIFSEITLEDQLVSEVQNLRGQIYTWQRRMSFCDNKKQAKYQRRIEENQKMIQEKEQQIEEQHLKIRSLVAAREDAFHPIWGELMHTGLEMSRFAQQVESFACLYCTKITNLSFYSPNQKFRSLRDQLPHEL